MSNTNNRLIIKATARVKVFVFGMMAVLFLLAAAVINTQQVQAAVPVPAGFQPILSDTGVTVYRKNYSSGQPDYVTVVDLRYATIRTFTGWPYSGSVERRSLATFWSDAVAQNTSSRRARVAVNGTFFSTNDHPNAPIAFGLKADWWLMSYGYGLNEPGTKLTLAFDASFGSSSIQPYSRQTFDAGIPNVIGGLDPNFDKDGKKNSFIQRTFVGVRDDNRDGHSETIIFFSSKTASQPWAVNILSGFGAGSKMMLDGGASSGLIVNGSSYITPGRTIPQAFIICAGK